MERRFPAGELTDIGDLATSLRERAVSLSVGDERVVEFLASVGSGLLKPAVARVFPELGALGFFLRRSALSQVLAGLPREGNVRATPRGLVFHVPPANVDTIFVYSWALSALAGNANIVRISPRSAGAATAVLDALNAALVDADPIIAETQAMISYGRDDAVTTALSTSCDLRVLWGGDASVKRLREFPLGPGARDITFPDRTSFSIVAADSYIAAAPADRDRMAAGFRNDIFWFDQAACSSPRTMFWVGSVAAAEQARADFDERLAGLVAGPVDPSMAVQTRVSTYALAAGGGATTLRYPVPGLATVDLASGINRGWLGAGVVPHVRVPDLADVAALVIRKDQTVTHFGFEPEKLAGFADAVAGRGVDRIVPIGQALDFAPIWDGYELIREYTRLLTVKV